MLSNFKLIVITSEKDVLGEGEIINDLFKAELQTLHIRKPANTIEKTKALLKTISTEFHPKIVLHSHYELLNDFNLKGIHLPEQVRENGAMNGLRNIISTSYHILEDIQATNNKFEYAFFSPIFKSISKEEYEPIITTEKIQEFLKLSKPKFPIIALGGITNQNILEVQSMGFSGAACIGYIWGSPDIIKQFEKLKKIIQP